MARTVEAKMNARTKAKTVKGILWTACAAALSAGSLGAWAADKTWAGAGDNSQFSTNANWLGNVAPSPNDTLIFDGFARLTPLNDFGVGTSFNGITFAPSAGPFNLTGNQLTLAGDILDNTPVLTQTINLPVSLNGVRGIDVVDTGTLLMNGVISGGLGVAGITKTGAGILTLGGANTFVGPINITGGILSVSSAGNLGPAGAAGAMRISGGALRATQNLTIPSARPIVLGPAAGTGEGTFDISTLDNSGTGAGGSSIVPITVTYGGVISDNGTPGAGSLVKTRFGTLVLSGANTYTGATKVKNGTLTLNFADAAAPASNIVAPSSALVLGGATAGLGQNNNATLKMVGKDGANNAQTFASTHIDIYGSVIDVTRGAGGTATLNLGALTHTPGGTVVIPTTALSPGLAGNVRTTTTVAGTRGILGGWAIAGDGSLPGPAPLGRGSLVGTDWATVDGTGKIVPYTGYVGAPVFDGTNRSTTFAGNAAIDADADKNVRHTGTGTGVVMRVDLENQNSTTDINTFAFTTSGASNTLAIGAGNTLRLGVSGGIFKQNVGNNQVYIGGAGGLISGNGSGPNIGSLTAGGPNANTPGEIVLTLNDTANTNGGLNILASIVDNGTGAVTVVKTGPMSVKIDGHNSYSGGTFINQGRFQLAGGEAGAPNPDGLGTGPVTIAPGAYLYISGVNSGTLFTGRGAIAGARANTAQNAPILNDMTISGTGTSQEGIGAIRLGNKALLTGKLTLGGDARIGGSSNNGNPNAAYDSYPGINTDGTTLYIDPSHDLAGQITGPFGLDVGSAVSITTNFKISNPANDWTGNTSFISGGGVTILRIGNNEVIPHGPGKGNLVWGPGVTANTATFDLNGFNETVNGLSTTTQNLSSAIIENTGFTATIIDDPANPGTKIYSIAAGPATLTVGGFDQTATFGGTIRDTNTTRTVTVPNPSGAGGTQTLTAPWAAAGAKVALTKIGNGVQTLSGANTYTGDTNVNGGTLSVTGSLASTGTVKVNASASGAGTLSGTGTVGNVVLGPRSGANAARVAPGITGATGTVGTLTMASLASNGGDLKVDLVGATSDLITVQGTASFPAATPSTISPNAGAKAGIYTILTAGTLNLEPGGLTVTDPNDPTARPATFGLVTDATSIKLNVTGGAKDIFWTGAANGNWDINTTANWRDTNSAVEKYFNGDVVTFGPTATNRNITLNTVVLPGEITVNNDAGADYTISGSGSISGGGKLTKQGAGTLIVLTDNTNSGPIDIQGGTIQVGNGGTSGALGSGQISNNGKLVFNRSDNSTLTASVSGSGGIDKLGAGVLTLAGNSSYTGTTRALVGTVRAGGANALGGSGASVEVSQGATLDVGGQNLTAVSVTVRGAGVGGTGALINTGGEQQNALNNVTLTGDTTVGGTGRFDVRGSGSFSTGAQGYKLTKVGNNTFTLAGVTVDEKLGDIDVQAGTFGLEGASGSGDPTKTLRLAAGTALQLTVLSNSVKKGIVSEGATIRANDGTGNAVDGTVSLTANSTFEATADDVLTFNGVVSGAGGVTKIGAGDVNLNNAANTYQGPTVINAGMLGVASLANGGLPSSLGSSGGGAANLVFNGGGLRYTGSTTTSTDRQFTLGANATFNASGGSAAMQFTNTAPVTMTGNGNLTVTLNGESQGDNTIAGAIGNRTGGATSVVKNDAGLWVLNGNNTYTGSTAANAGVLRVGGSIAGSSAVSIAGGASYEADSTQTVQNLALNDSAGLVIRPGAFKTLKLVNPTINLVTFTDIHTNAMIVDYTGESQLPAMRTAILSGYNNGGWNSFGIISTEAQDTTKNTAVGYGEAGEILGPSGGTFGGVSVDGSAVLIRYVLKGDANLNGTVDFPDLVALAQNYNASGDVPWNKGDFTYDGNVDFNDLVALAQNYNKSTPVAAIAGAPLGFEEDLARAFAQVPEPGSLALVALAAGALAGRRRRR
jgi:autotransporter-associated beta strand protein